MIEHANLHKKYYTINILEYTAYLYILYYKGTSSPILRRSEDDRVQLCDMKT